MSPQGVEAFGDDDISGSLSATESGYLDFMIDKAASVLDLHLVKRYDLADLTTSNFMRFANAVLAARAIFARRGEGAPESVMREFDEFMDYLVAIRDNIMEIPDVIDSFNHLPTVTNFWTDFTKTVSPVRVQDAESTGDNDWQGQLKRSVDTFHYRNV